MEKLILIKENWFTRPPHPRAGDLTALLALVFFGLSFLYLSGFESAQSWMAASKQSVFQDHQYWRLWTTLFAHGDREHLVNNALLFFPLAFLLMSYFGSVLFPLIGFALGGVVNFLVLWTMPLGVSLIGISGLVYWMGAVWFTLFVLIDRRKNFKVRFGNALFLTLMLFVPETYKPQVSYMSHFIGFMLGIVSALVYYSLNRSRFAAAEVLEVVEDEDLEHDFNKESHYNQSAF